MGDVVMAVQTVDVYVLVMSDVVKGVIADIEKPDDLLQFVNNTIVGEIAAYRAVGITLDPFTTPMRLMFILEDNDDAAALATLHKNFEGLAIPFEDMKRRAYNVINESLRMTSV
jgi:hypothetical protein